MKVSSIFNPVKHFWRFCLSRPVKDPYARVALNTMMSLEEIKNTLANMFKNPPEVNEESTAEPPRHHARRSGYIRRKNCSICSWYYQAPYSNEFFHNYPGSGL